MKFLWLEMDISKIKIERFFPFRLLKNLSQSKLRQMFSIHLTSVQKLGNIWSCQKCGICGFCLCCSKMADKEYWPLFVVGLDEVTINDNLCPNFVFITLEFEIVDFFQHPTFFHKKWLINIYFTSENHNSLRKYHSRSEPKNIFKMVWITPFFRKNLTFARVGF